MTPTPYTEDTLVQQTTADYLRDELGWDREQATPPPHHNTRNSPLHLIRHHREVFGGGGGEVAGLVAVE